MYNNLFDSHFLANLKTFFKNVSKFLSACKDINPKDYPEFVDGLITWAKHSVLPLTELEKYVTKLAESTEFWNQTDAFFKGLGTLGTALEIIDVAIDSAVTMFGDWQRHRALLEVMLNAIDSIEAPEKDTDEYKEYQNMKEAMRILLDEYDHQYFSAIYDLARDMAIIGFKALIGKLCPAADALLAIGSLAAKSLDVGEVNKQIRMQQFYEILERGMMQKFQEFCDLGTISSSIYGQTDELISFYLNMAIHVNQLAFKHDRYNESEKTVYKGNIKKIKEKFDDYLLCEIPG